MVPEQVASESDEVEVALPPIVYVPARRPEPGDSDVVLEMRALVDGRVALLAYSAMDRLVASCGEDQPWALVPTVRLEELRAEGGGWDVVMLDRYLPDELRPMRGSLSGEGRPSHA